jgi:primosomal protein N' (replication factor Y)
LEGAVTVGKRVLAPFGKRKTTGYILEVNAPGDCEDIKDIIRILDDEPLFSADDLKFYQWLSDYYIHPIGKTLAHVLPAGIDRKHEAWILPALNEPAGPHNLSAFQQTIMDVLRDYPRGMAVSQLRKKLERQNIHADIDALHAADLLAVEERLAGAAVNLKKEKIISLGSSTQPPDVEDAKKKITAKEERIIDFLKAHGPSPIGALQDAFVNIHPAMRNLEKKGKISIAEQEINRPHDQSFSIGRMDECFVLNPAQETALKAICASLAGRTFSPVLLHGVTGSGKTEVYLQAIEKALAMGGSVLYLVPEIALTPQLISRFQAKFGDMPIAVIHSAIAPGSRYDQWRQIQRGDISVVVGARSALFAPVRNLKLIICDEEHDHSYKQEERMRYNARDLAVVRAQLTQAVVVLGSATPGIQTYHNCRSGKYHYLTLPSRVEDRPMPAVEIVDMCLYGKEKGKALPVLSSHLLYAMERTLAAKKQILLFLNRRGYHTFLICPGCGYVFKCRNCAVSLIHHAGLNTLKCHYCDYAIPATSTCPECGGKNVCAYGTGTEKLEEEVKRFFPDARVARMDSDTTAKKGAFGKILQDLDGGAIDILVGTQMITKGHDFPNITLVGVVSADAMLNMPDFRAAERTFQALMQVAGRGGRSDSPGKVVIQTFNPDHYAVKCAKFNDYEGFYNQEMLLRTGLAYPPLSRLVNIHISSTSRERGIEGINRIGKTARDLVVALGLTGKVELLGPAEAPIARIKGRHRWQFILKGRSIRELNRLTRRILEKEKQSGLMIKCDVDPVSFM